MPNLTFVTIIITTSSLTIFESGITGLQYIGTTRALLKMLWHEQKMFYIFCAVRKVR